jgi:hypothetical protein
MDPVMVGTFMSEARNRLDSITGVPSLSRSDYARVTLDPTNIPDPFIPAWQKSGEYRLFYAILEDALDVISKYRRSKAQSGGASDQVTRAYREAIDWIGSYRSDYLMDFEIVCLVCDIEAEPIRQRVLSEEFVVEGRLRHNNAGHHGRRMALSRRRKEGMEE